MAMITLSISMDMSTWNISPRNVYAVLTLIRFVSVSGYTTSKGLAVMATEKRRHRISPWPPLSSCAVPSGSSESAHDASRT